MAMQLTKRCGRHIKNHRFSVVKIVRHLGCVDFIHEIKVRPIRFADSSQNGCEFFVSIVR